MEILNRPTFIINIQNNNLTTKRSFYNEANLYNKLTLLKNTKIILTVNFQIKAGIINGSISTIIDFVQNITVY